MKRILSIVMIFISAVVWVEAQSTKGELVLGFNASQIDGDAYGGYKHIGLVAGAGIDVAITDKFHYGHQLLYSSKGATEGSIKAK